MGSASVKGATPKCWSTPKCIAWLRVNQVILGRNIHSFNLDNTFMNCSVTYSCHQFPIWNQPWCTDFIDFIIWRATILLPNVKSSCGSNILVITSSSTYVKQNWGRETNDVLNEEEEWNKQKIQREKYR